VSAQDRSARMKIVGGREQVGKHGELALLWDVTQMPPPGSYSQGGLFCVGVLFG